MLPCLNSKSISRIDLFAEGDARWYRVPNHIHDFTTAFDPPETRLGLTLDGSLEKEYFLADGEPFDGCLKLTGSWLNFYCNHSHFRVSLNGHEIWAGDLHLPRVCAGWPSVYWKVPAGCMKRGRNVLKMESGGTPLLVNQCSLFMREKPGVTAEMLFAPRVLTRGQRFCVTLICYESLHDLRIEHDEAVETEAYPSEAGVGEQDFFMTASQAGAGRPISFVFDGGRVDVDLPPILDVPTGVPCHVGTDSDDHPHDDTGMMSELLLYFFRSGMGDLVMFRPKQGRNCIVSPSTDLCRPWLDICRRFGGRYMVCEWPPEGELPGEIHSEIAGDDAFIGYHFHEPYFLMVEPFSDEAMRKASNFQERKDAYVAALKRCVDRGHLLGGKAACGEASWLAVYGAEAGFDIMNVEVVTGLSPQMGAARGALRGRPGTALGHHIAIEWYLGFPYDNLKSHRFWLMMLLTYTHGGQYIYTENSLFFTNSNEKHDPEDEFTSRNRELIRRFWDMARLQPRFGDPVPELAVVYGNLESMLWYHDDVLPEMDDASGWGELLWNRWRGDLHKPCMRALDAWLPPVEIERYHANRSILKWFAGNPYGNVEMVSVERPIEVLGQYKILAFLGWNTMTCELIEKLKCYVRAGGTLFIAGCHFDTRVLPGGEYEIDTSCAEDLLGAKVSGPGPTAREVHWLGREFKLEGDLRLCDAEPCGADVLASDGDGRPVLLRNRFGDGLVYFYNFWDHPASVSALELTKAVMSHLGELNRSEFGIEEAYGVNCSHWYDPDTGIRRLYLVNVNWMKPQRSRTCMLRLWGRPYPAMVDHCDPLVVTIKGPAAVIPDSPFVYVEDIEAEDNILRIRLIGTGRHTVRIIPADAGARLVYHTDLANTVVESAHECALSVLVDGTTDLELELRSSVP